MGYITNFIVYTLAMVGVIVVALLVFKNATSVGVKGGSKFLKVHDTLSLGPRKTLYIVSAGQEKFLIAGDVDKTTLISKLENNKNEQLASANFEQEVVVPKSFKETLEEMPREKKYIDKSIIGITSTQNKPYNSVMKNLAEMMRTR